MNSHWTSAETDERSPSLVIAQPLKLGGMCAQSQGIVLHTCATQFLSGYAIAGEAQLLFASALVSPCIVA